ncbi:MAG: hypothetical protein R3E08_10105 [Thiotrichaceae bacterium]
MRKKVTINYTKKQDLEKVVAEGKPAKFKQTPDGGRADIQANRGAWRFCGKIPCICSKMLKSAGSR